MSEQKRRNQFLRLSADLTGFTIQALDDQNFPIRVTSQDQLPAKYYLAICDERMGRDFVDKQLIKPTHRAVKKAAESSESNQGKAARALIKLWYTGVWIQPFDYQSYKADSDGSTDYIVNTVGYKRGLMWLTGQTHAMGYSELPFGYWNSPPGRSLDQLTKGRK